MSKQSEWRSDSIPRLVSAGIHVEDDDEAQEKFRWPEQREKVSTMILPGNSRQVIVDAVNDSPVVPHATTSKIVNDLEDAGYGIVHREELTGIINGLLEIIKAYDTAGDTLTDIRVAKAIALCDLLAD